jgi:hypothetical protein
LPLSRFAVYSPEFPTGKPSLDVVNAADRLRHVRHENILCIRIDVHQWRLIETQTLWPSSRAEMAAERRPVACRIAVRRRSPAAVAVVLVLSDRHGLWLKCDLGG